MSSPKRPQSLAVPGNPTCLGGCGRVTSWFLLSPAQRLWTCRPRSCNLRKPQRALTVDRLGMSEIIISLRSVKPKLTAKSKAQFYGAFARGSIGPAARSLPLATVCQKSFCLVQDTEDLPVFGPATCFTRQPALMPVFEPLLACAHLFPSSVYAAMPA